MSWLNTTLDVPFGQVKSQYDFPKASNQCSWCAYELASKLWAKLPSVNTDEYNKCIDDASDLRAKCNKYKCGENIDDKDIIECYEHILTIISFYRTELNSELKKDLLDILDPELRDTFFKRDDYPCETVDFLKECVSGFLNTHRRFMVVNRYGQSFSLVGLGNGQVWIFDSHFRVTGKTTAEKAIEYVLKDEGGYNMIFWGMGYFK